MLNVETWKWADASTNQAYFKAAVECSAAVASVDIGAGIDDPAKRSRAIARLGEAVETLEHILDAHQCLSPIPYVDLTCGRTVLALFVSHGHEGDVPDSLALYQKALQSSREAILLFNQSTGWSFGRRYECHVCMAFAHFHLASAALSAKLASSGSGARSRSWQDELTMSRTELENAKEYQIDQARLQETAAWLQRTLDQLDETSNSSGQSTTRGHGCLGVIVCVLGALLTGFAATGLWP